MDTGRELFERYLQAVKKYLPGNRRGDILAELRANLEAQIEEREEALGRTLTEGEMTDWLKELGAPVHMAGRYQPQQYLIGPAIFPMYWYALRLALLWGAAIYGVVNVVQLATQAMGGGLEAEAVATAVARLPWVLMTIAAWVTLVFAGLEFVATRYPQHCPKIPGLSGMWSPSSLPPLEKERHDEKRSRSIAHFAAEVVFGYLFLIWLLLIPHYPYLLMGPGLYAMRSTPYRPGPIWIEFYWVVLGLNIIQLAWNCVVLWQGTWQQPRIAQNVASKVFGLVGMGVLLTAPGHAYLVLRDAASDQAQYGSKLDGFNNGIWHAVGVVCVIVAAQLVWETGKAVLESMRRSSSYQ